jgi:hypothetical protein
MIVDIHTRECLAIEAGQSLRGEDVVRVLNRLKQERGVPLRYGRILGLTNNHSHSTSTVKKSPPAPHTCLAAPRLAHYVDYLACVLACPFHTS